MTNGGILLAILLYFVLKFIYLFGILILIGALVAKFKAMGAEKIKKWESGENGER